MRERWRWTPSDIIGLLRGGGSSSKGSDYERETCKRISLWWTNWTRDDVFWRSSGSGARAKVRGRAGVGTAGQSGDVAATDPCGVPLIDMFTIELKRGYSEHTIQDIVDKGGVAGEQEFDRFFAQTIESHVQAGSRSWLLITRRDRREALLWCPVPVVRALMAIGAFPAGVPMPNMKVTFKPKLNATRISVACMHLEDFLAHVTPEHIKTLANTED